MQAPQIPQLASLWLVSFLFSWTSKPKFLFAFFDSTECISSHFSQITNGPVTKNMFFIVAVYSGLCHPIIQGLYTEYAIFRIPMIQYNLMSSGFEPLFNWIVVIIHSHHILDLSHFSEQGDESYFQHQATTQKVNIYTYILYNNTCYYKVFSRLVSGWWCIILIQPYMFFF